MHNFSAAAKDSIFNNSYKRGAGIHQCPTWGCSEAQGCGVQDNTSALSTEQKESGSLQVSLDCIKWELKTASKAKQTNTMETAVKGKKCQGSEHLWGKYCISLSFTAWEKLQYNATPQKGPRKLQQ